MQVGRPQRTTVEPPVGDGIALCCIGRRENRYAREFIGHYKAIGFDKVFLCDNNQDGEERFSDVIGDYMEEGFVEVLDYRNRHGVQRLSYDEVYRRHGNGYRWMAFFDFDEYLTTVSGCSVSELMENYSGFDCVLFNWMNYGDNGLLRDDGRPLEERFTEPLPFGQCVQYEGTPENSHVKCILRGGLKGVSFGESPHVPDEPVLRCCNASSVVCRQKSLLPADHSVAYLRHYCTKTCEEWFLNKWQKGTGNKESIDAFRSKYAGRFFAYNQWTKEKEVVMRECLGLGEYADAGHRNVLVVNFNTQELTTAAIRSLNRHTPGCRIVLFDNSDKVPFVNSFDNVEVLDNTKGQLIDFDSLLDAHEDKYPTPENNWGSAKHCKTIDYCFELLPDGFLLMDSDIVVKEDVSMFFDSSCAWVGKVQVHRSRFGTLPRVLPFLCYINVPMCREHGIRYYNDDKMFALSHRSPDAAYDTGCWFYEECARLKLPVNHARIGDYMEHFGHGSWMGFNEKQWLESHRWLL